MALLACAFPASPRRWLALLLLVVVGAGPAAADGPGPTEYQIKSVFLFNFAQFVEWPADAFAASDDPMVIGVLGEDPFGGTLDDTVRGEIVGHRKLVVQRYARAEDIVRCHILFISRSESERLEQVLSVLRGRSIFTVCDTTGYALRGVMVRFVTEKNKIRLRINLDSARAAGLVVSSKLLRSAEIVTTKPN